MQLNYNKIKSVFEKSKYSKREVAGKCGLSRPTLDGLLDGADVKVSTLVAFASVFELPMSFLFDEETQSTNQGGESSEAQLREQIAQLKSQLADKERIIQLLEQKL